MARRVFPFLFLFLCGWGWAQPDVTLETIMSHPRWIGLWPEEVAFLPGGGSIVMVRHADPRGYEAVELDRRGQVLKRHPGRSSLPGRGSQSRGVTLFEWSGDLFRSHAGEVRQLTRTPESETQPRWIDNQAYTYKRDDQVMVAEATGLQSQVAEVLPEDPPEGAQPDFLRSQQTRLFPVLKERDQDRLQRRASHAVPRIYLGEGRELVRAELTNDRKRLLVVDTTQAEKKRDQMPLYVTRDGFVQTEELRAKVGSEPPQHHTFTLHDLTTGSAKELSLAHLPTYKPGRQVRLEDLRWSSNGRLALFLLSQDFEDRWLVEVDFENARWQLIEHLHDPAWHSWDLNEFGWTPDGETFWYQSEKTGYAHLYTWQDGKTRPLTSGAYEVTRIEPDSKGDGFYFRANKVRPGRYDVFRVDSQGRIEQVSTLGGQTTYDLAPDGDELVLLHSTTARPPEVYLQKAAPGVQAQPITDSVSKEFTGIDWTVPEFVEVPSTHHSRPIPAKVYLPKGQKSGAAVVFIHGAGYLQNADEGWSYYFREFMFHTLLTRLGVVVMDMDYRASAGYGRDWRTAIYRQMGTPELEDLKDGVSYLVSEHGVDPDRVGVYGGSYGGFLTLMALFKEPDLFACGAALRPVTDWSQYEHEYTARILNTPDEDPEAFDRSSPIEFADGLTKPLLMAHGMLDDNVVVQDTVRLTQRLIQLKKQDWEMALYPVEPHGFLEPESWLDEYRRVFKLFRTHLEI